jgi:hypothetical protein
MNLATKIGALKTRGSAGADRSLPGSGSGLPIDQVHTITIEVFYATI